MRVGAVMMLRNEADIISANVRYHSSVGVTDFFIVDNGSSDRTPKILARLAREFPGLRWTKDDGPYQQSMITTGLAQEAHTAGVDWVVPIDADEFWFSGDSGLPGVLSTCDAAALEVELSTFVQYREVSRLREDNLLSMTRRIRAPKVYADAWRLVQSGDIAFVEMAYPPKWISRSSASLSIHPGNHGIDGIDGTRTSTNAIQCFHAPLRAREVLHAKAEQGRRWREIGAGPEAAWHTQRWADLEASGELYADWAANSWRLLGGVDDAVIDTSNGPVPVENDTRLRDLVRPFIPKRRLGFRRRAARSYS
jgi:Glycosyl transferase family 2